MIIKKVEPNYSNPLAPCNILIKRLIPKIYPTAESVDFVKPLSGGLSGAISAVVLPSGTSHMKPLVVKIDHIEKIKNELGRYEKYLKNQFSNEPISSAAILKYPDNVSKGLIKEKGADERVYSILAYTYAGDCRSGIKEIQTFDTTCLKMIKVNKDEQEMTFNECLNILGRLCELLNNTFYKIDAGKFVNTELKDIPQIPWDSLIPIASCVSCMVPDWFEFVNTFPTVWRKRSSANIKYKSVICHGDLRCANILIPIPIDGSNPFIVDYGLTGPGHPLSDLSRLEADILLRVGLTVHNHREILHKILCEDQLIVKEWESGDNTLLRFLYQLRVHANALASSLGVNDYRADIYHHFLLGHAIRHLIRYDPALRFEQKKHDFLWFVLSLARRLLLNDKTSLNLPISTLTLEDIKKCGLEDFFWGPERRNVIKKKVLQTHKGPLRLLFQTGKSYLDNTVNSGGMPGGIFYTELVNRLEIDPKIGVKIVLLNPYSVEGSKLGMAEVRGELQGPEVDLEYHKEHTNLFKRFNKCLESFKNLRSRFKNIDLRVSHYSPDATMLITDEGAFIEPYLIGCLSMRYTHQQKMNAPEFFVKKGTDLYKVADEQFDFMWKRAIDVNEYEARKEDFEKDFIRSERLRRKLISLHESWIAVDPVVGCPNKCDYCFLTPFRINNKVPYLFRSAEDAYSRLKENKWFSLQRKLLDNFLKNDERLPVPVACGNYTEMMDDQNRYQLEYPIGFFSPETTNLELLQKMIQQHADLISSMDRPSVFCMITKQNIPDSLIEILGEQLRYHPKLRIAVFVSLSFLPQDIEYSRISRNIPMLLGNFERLNNLNTDLCDQKSDKRRIAGIHFWRPLIPCLNDSNLVDDLRQVQTHHAISSVAVGLKVSERLAKYISLKGGLGGTFIRGGATHKFELPSTVIEGKESEYFDEKIKQDAIKAGRNLNHPVFLHTSCAVSHAFGRPDYNATYDKCIPPDIDVVNTVMYECGLKNKYSVKHDYEGDNIIRSWIHINEKIDQEVQTFIRQMTGMEVEADVQATHEWRGNVSKMTFGKVCLQSHCPDSQRQICRDYYTKRLNSQLIS